MPFDPSTVQGFGPPDSTPSSPPPAFDPSTAREVQPKTAGSRIGETLRGALDIPTGVARGLAGDVYGASQLATDIGVPTSPDDPIEGWLKRFSQAPSKSWGDTAGRVVGGAIPAFLGNPVAAGAATGAVQPTKSGDLPSHAIGGLGGAAGGAVAGALGGTAAQQAMRNLGVRITPGRMVPFIGREWERFAARLPVLNRLIGHGRQVSLDDFQNALYRDAWEPLGGNPPVTATGSEGLEQLRTAIGGRLNNVLSRSSLPATSMTGLNRDLAGISAEATKDLNRDALRRFGSILRDDVAQPIRLNNGTLPGSRLAGKNGIIANLNNRARQLWRSQDPQDKALASYIDRIEKSLLDNAQIGGLGRGELDAARQSYARYKTLSRAGSGSTAEGNIDPDHLLAELRRENQDLFARGGMRMQPTALAARRAGVPSISETRPDVSPWEFSTLGLGLAGLERYVTPQAWVGAATAAAPSLLYNRGGMTLADLLARVAPSTAAPVGAAAGQVDPSRYVWPSSP